jgi:hypothetical protein
MNCPKCKTWNPDDKQLCWRCQAELPKPQPPKTKRQSTGFPTWMWIVIVVFFALTAFAQCMFIPVGR